VVYLQLLFEREVLSGRIQLVKELLPSAHKEKKKPSTPEASLIGLACLFCSL